MRRAKTVSVIERHFKNNCQFAIAYLTQKSLDTFKNSRSVIVNLREEKNYSISQGSWRIAQVYGNEDILEEDGRYYFKCLLVKVS